MQFRLLVLITLISIISITGLYAYAVTLDVTILSEVEDDDDTTEPLQMAEECLKTISKVSVKEKIRGLRIKIREKEAAGEDAIELMIEVVQLQKGIND